MAITSTTLEGWVYQHPGSTGIAVRSSASTSGSIITRLTSSNKGTTYYATQRTGSGTSSDPYWIKYYYGGGTSGSQGWSATYSSGYTYFTQGTGKTVYSGSAFAKYYYPNAGSSTYTLQATDTRTSPGFTLRTSPGGLTINGTKTNITLTINYNNGSTNGSQVGKTWTQTPYTFNGWDEKTSASAPSSLTAGTKDYAASASRTSNSDLYYYADYTKGTASTKYSDNSFAKPTDPSKSNDTSSSYTVSFSDAHNTHNAQTATITKTYSFSKWTDASGNTVSFPYTFTSNTTITANYNLASTSVASVTLPTPTADTYVFGGWSDGTTTYAGGSSYTPSSDVTLTAIWTLDQFTVSLSVNLEGWTGSDSYGPTGAGKYNVDDWVNIDCGLKTGYKFIKWTDNNNSDAQISTSAKYSFQMPSNDVSYRANVQAISYYIAYDPNGGTGSMDNSTHTYDVQQQLSSNKFTREGYKFLGWSESFSATSATYSNLQVVKNLSSVDGSTITLYAIWAPSTQVYIYAKNADGTLEWRPALKYVYNTSQGHIFTVYQTDGLKVAVAIYDETETTTIASADSTSDSSMLVTMLKPNTTYKLYIKRTNGYVITPTITGSCDLTLLMNAVNYKSYQISNITGDTTLTFTYDTSTQE